MLWSLVFCVEAQIIRDRNEIKPHSRLRYVEREVISESFGMRLIFFHTTAFRLEVIDREKGDSAGFADAFRDRGCVAGVNGGFFQKNFEPLGLMIASGERRGAFTMGSSLLSGVLYADHDGIHLLRKAEFRDHQGISALVQSGPFLVDRGTAVKGLSETPARRRTFVLTDYRGNWVLGVSDAVSLRDLGEILARPELFPEFVVNRALNLDGGSSCGLFFDRPSSDADIAISPFKRVRNYVGIVPR